MKQCLTTRWTIIQRVFFVLIMAAAGPAGAQIKGDPARGAEKAKTCVACHGRTGRGPMSGVPAPNTLLPPVRPPRLGGLY